MSVANVVDFGAIGNGSNDDTVAIQNAINSAESIYFPKPAKYYKITSSLKIGGLGNFGHKRLFSDINVIERSPIISSVLPISIFELENNTSSNLNRNISLENISASNIEKPVINLINSHNLYINRCYFSTYRNPDACIKLQKCPRPNIQNSMITCSGGGFAIATYEDCNGLRVHNSTLTGGSIGGVLHMEVCQSTSFCYNIIEVSKYGVILSSGERPDKFPIPVVGNCHGFTCIGNYFEQVESPFILGTTIDSINGLSVIAATIQSNLIGSTSTPQTSDNPVFRIGRLHASSISNNSVWRNKSSTKPFLYFSQNKGGNPSYAIKNVIQSNMIYGGKGGFISTDQGIGQYIESKNSIQNDRTIN